MSWHNITQLIDEYASTCRLPARRLQAVSLYSTQPADYYFHPVTKKAAADPYGPDAAEVRRVLTRARLPHRIMPLDGEEALGCGWVKVAEARPLRTGAELMQFLPSTTGIPNAPSPLAAMIASALVGGGLGYGAGWLGEKLMPQSWQTGRLRRTGAALGALAGAVPAGVWAATSLANGRSITDPWPGKEESTAPRPEDLPLAVGSSKQADAFGNASADVNMDALGQVLWEGSAPAPLTAATIGTMHAASQFPDDNDKPGWVTGHQLGQLAVHAGQGYLVGLAVGKALNLAIGSPTRPVANAGAALGIIDVMLPKLFGV